jgi:hypothetical protein
MAKSPFIDDGYTEEFVLPAGDQWPEVRGSFRPLPGPELAEFSTRSIRAGKADDVTGMYDATVDALLMSIKSWDLRTAGGNLVAISKESFGHLRKPFIEAMFVTIHPRGKAVDEKN